MRKVAVRDTDIVLVLTKEEAKAIKRRLEQHTGIVESNAAKRAKVKLYVALGAL